MLQSSILVAFDDSIIATDSQPVPSPINNTIYPLVGYTRKGSQCTLKQTHLSYLSLRGKHTFHICLSAVLYADDATASFQSCMCPTVFCLFVRAPTLSACYRRGFPAFGFFPSSLYTGDEADRRILSPRLWRVLMMSSLRFSVACFQQFLLGPCTRACCLPVLWGYFSPFSTCRRQTIRDPRLSARRVLGPH